MADFGPQRGVDAFGTVSAQQSVWTCRRRCERPWAGDVERGHVKWSRGRGWRLAVTC